MPRWDSKLIKAFSINIDGIAALLYTLTDKVDPIEIDGQTKYEIKVINQGSKEASNVRIAAATPDGLQAVEATGPTAERIRDNDSCLLRSIDCRPRVKPYLKSRCKDELLAIIASVCK